MKWTTDSELVGRRITIACGYSDEEEATVIAVSIKTDMIRVRTDDGDILTGNQWDVLD